MHLRPIAYISLALCGCPARRPDGPAPDARPSVDPAVAGTWRVTPSGGTGFRVAAGRYLRGALRLTDDAVAPAPWPATALVAAARVGETWLFAAEDGTVYRSTGFLGRLEPVAALPARPVAGRTTSGEGALLTVDRDGHVRVVDSDGRIHPFAAEGAIAGASVAPGTALVIAEPGVLLATEDGGEHVRPVALPSGVATGVTVRDGTAWVATSAGTLRWQHGGVALVADAPDLDAATVLPATVERRAREYVTSVAVLPDFPLRAAARRDGTLAVLYGDEGSTLATVDAQTAVVRSLAPAPGEGGCGLYSSGAGLRAVCNHAGWARAVYAEGPRGAWSVLRDEARAEPMGPVAFDDAGGGWVIAAPCSQQPGIDPAVVCMLAADGGRTAVRLPFIADPVAMHDGVALLVERSPGGDHARTVLVHGGTVTAVDVSVTYQGAHTGRWQGDHLVFWDTADAGPPTLVRGTPVADGRYTWQRIRAPVGAVAGAHGPDGAELAVGTSAAQLWRSDRGAAFVPMASPVAGAADTMALDRGAPTYCVGTWCLLGGALTWTSRGAPAVTVVARAAALPAALPLGAPAEGTPRALRCASGVAVPGVEIDHGVAAPGYAMRWELSGTGVTVHWYGDTLHGTARGTLPPRTGNPPIAGRAVVGVTAPAGMLERCGEGGCEDFVATAGGVAPLRFDGPLGGVPGTLFARTGGTLALSAAPAGGVTVAEAVALDPVGAVVARRTFALAAPAEGVTTGTLDGRDGVWSLGPPGTLGFHPLVGEGPVEASRVPELSGATRGCLPLEARGVVHLTHGLTELAGEGWRPDPGEWLQQEDLAVIDHGTCIAGMAGGESRDEAEAEESGVAEQAKVRSFAVRATGEASFEGWAWGHGRRIPLRCTLAVHSPR